MSTIALTINGCGPWLDTSVWTVLEQIIAMNSWCNVVLVLLLLAPMLYTLANIKNKQLYLVMSVSNYILLVCGSDC